MAAIRENENGFIYGITFIDLRNKVVFNGSDLGKIYSAKAIRERIAVNANQEQKSVVNLLAKKESGDSAIQINKVQSQDAKEAQDQKQSSARAGKENLLELLMNKEKNDLRIPFDFTRKKKKRRKPKL